MKYSTKLTLLATFCGFFSIGLGCELIAGVDRNAIPVDQNDAVSPGGFGGAGGHGGAAQSGGMGGTNQSGGVGGAGGMVANGGAGGTDGGM